MNEPTPRPAGKPRWRLGALAICAVALVAVLVTRRPPDDGPILAGKSTVYWLEHLPMPEAVNGFLDAGHPLEQAGPEIIPYLVKAVEGEYGVSTGFLTGMGNLLRQLAPEPVGKLLPERRAPTGAIQTFAAFRLGQFGTNAVEAVPNLIHLLGHSNPRGPDQGRVIQALGNIGPDAQAAVPALVDTLANGNRPWLKGWIAQSLMQIGNVPTNAIPALRAVKGEDGHIAGPAMVAIWMANPESDSLEALQACLRNPTNAALRAHAARSLAFPPKIDSLTAELLRAQLQETNPATRQGAAIALAGRVNGGDQERVTAVLVEGVGSGEFMIPCAQALGRLGQTAHKTLPALREAQAHAGDKGSVYPRVLSEAINAIEMDSRNLPATSATPIRPGPNPP